MRIKIKNKLVLFKFSPEATKDLGIFEIKGENTWAVVREAEPEGGV